LNTTEKKSSSSLLNWLNLIIMLLLFGNSFASTNCLNCHVTQPEQILQRSLNASDKAVGVMDKGQLQVNTSNFGNVADYHVWFTNSAHWPRYADSNRQYAFGLGLMLGIDENNVIESVTQAAAAKDWYPTEDAHTQQFSGLITGSDETAFQATSDLAGTWPKGFLDENGNWVSADHGIWPGDFRVDVNSMADDELDLHPLEDLPRANSQFASDRDIFSIFDDHGNPMGNSGITVEQTGYSYGRPYAEDFVFWNFIISNNGTEDLDSIHAGFYAKLRPDYDMHDYLNFIDTDDDGVKDFVYVYDINNTPDDAWTATDDPLGIVGLRVFDTPGQIGITDFHHFERGKSPDSDEKFWAIMTSDSSSEYLQDPSVYFHGDNQQIDYTGADSLEVFYPVWQDSEVSQVESAGNGINFIVSCGPFDLPADSSVTISMGMIMGDAGSVPSEPDLSDLMQNVNTANEMYRLYFQGSGPPDPPGVHAAKGDGQVTLYWTAEPSESSIDVWTNQQDFEGYKIFRSSDYGQTWGNPVTDIFGNQTGYFAPIAQFDYTFSQDSILYAQDISGTDPAFPQSLGENTGLNHSFTDHNLINGLEYWYAVCAYDRGNQDPDNLVQSYVNAPGTSPEEIHTVSVTPGVLANNLEAGHSFGGLEPIGGPCSGVVRLELSKPDELLDHGYKITFNDSAITEIVDEDTTYGIAFSLIDTTDELILIEDQSIEPDSDQNFVTADGFILYFEQSLGVKSMGWTKVHGDTCTFDWRIHSKWPDLVPSGQAYGEDIDTIDDWRIVVDYSGGDSLIWFDAFTNSIQPEKQHVPIVIEVIKDSDFNNPIDVTSSCWLGEFMIGAPVGYRSNYYSPLGWDLEPGGLGYLAGSTGWYEKHVDVMLFEEIITDPFTGDTIPNYLYFYTNNNIPITNLTHHTTATMSRNTERLLLHRMVMNLQL